jgi:hypothetical protein
MGLTKEEAIRQLEGSGGVSRTSNQQALVQKLSGTAIQKQIKHVIPGGTYISENIGKDELPSVIFTWLRRVRHFKDVTLSFASELKSLQVNEVQVVDFDQKNKMPEWEFQGKKWLAERIADVLKQRNIIAVKVDKQGIKACYDVSESFGPQNENWEPHLLFTPFKPGV